MEQPKTGTLLYVRQRLSLWSDFEINGMPIQGGPAGSIGMLMVYESIHKFLDEFPGEEPMLLRVGDAVPVPE